MKTLEEGFELEEGERKEGIRKWEERNFFVYMYCTAREQKCDKTMIVYVYAVLVKKNTSFLDHEIDIIYYQITCSLYYFVKCLVMVYSHFLNVTRNPKILE